MIGLILSILLAAAAPAQDRGYQIAGNQVVVNARRHWQNWSYPPGTLELTPEGQVRARQWRKDINAVKDIADFLRLNIPVALGKKKPEEITLADALQAGSNPGQVAAVLDGDPSTYWEPEPLPEGAEVASRWWFVVDLGRFVSAEKITLKFVAEGQGDPFLLFDVLVSDGVKPARVRGSATPEYRSALRTLQRNKTQRVFEIDLTGENQAVAGEGLRFVQVVVTGSDFDRGREVTREEYGALPVAERGAVEYYKRLADGQEVAIKQAVYEQLAPQRQGSIRHFRRERPRLAELEVWAEGDEILSGTLARGGAVDLPGGEDANLRSFFDGDLETSSNLIIRTVQVAAVPERSLFFDLGSTFWVDTQRMAYGRGLYRGSFADYRLDFSDGARAADGSLKWKRVMSRQQAQQNGVRFDGNDFDPIEARFFRVQYSLGTGGLAVTSLAEIQLYGEGYQPQVELESDLIRLGGSRNLLRIDWEADTPPGTQVLIQTRTGDDLEEELHYFKKDGTQVTETEYKKLLSIFRGEITTREVEGRSWSDWSEPYSDPAGSAITSPSPREFLKLRATLRSSDPRATATLSQVRLHFADPVAQGLVGELDPVQLQSLGQPQTFSLFIKPQFAGGDLGFDQLLVRVPVDMSLEFGGLYAGRQTDFAGEGLDRLALAGVELIPSGADSLRLAFPLIGPKSGVEVLRLDFRSALYSTGAVVEAAFQRSGAGASQWQRVDPGNAFAGVESSSLTLVGVVQRKELIANLQVKPALFSPNGDGINDQVVFEFSVVLLGDTSPVVIEIRDLSGRLVRRLASAGQQAGTGRRRISWDGRDQQDHRAPAGIYLARLRLDTQTEGAGLASSGLTRRIALAY